MTLSESNIGAKLIDLAMHTRGWIEDLIRREEIVGAADGLHTQSQSNK
jgi:hypothetical protein